MRLKINLVGGLISFIGSSKIIQNKVLHPRISTTFQNKTFPEHDLISNIKQQQSLFSRFLICRKLVNKTISTKHLTVKQPPPPKSHLRGFSKVNISTL